MGTHPIFESDFDCLTEMAEVVATHEVKSVKNQGEVIVDNDRALPRERNPELDQLLEYLSTMGEMMRTEEDKATKAQLCLNCTREMGKHMEGTLKWRKLSFLCESIIQQADLVALADYFAAFETLDGDVIDKLATGEHSYIVIRAALRRFVRLMHETQNVESKVVKACAKSLKPLTDIYKREESSIIRRLRNKYSSLLFRDLMSTHAGIVWTDKQDNLGNYGVEIQLKQQPKACRKQFNALIEEIISIPNIDDLGLCEKASPSLGLVLVLAKVQRNDVRTLLLEHVKPDNSQLKEYLKSGPGGFLLEKLLFAMDEAELRHFYDSWVRGRLEELFMHDTGNFLLQRMLVLSTDELFEAIIKQINALGLLKQAWVNNKGGVLARFAERAGGLSEEKQVSVIDHLKSAVCIEQPNVAHGLLLASGQQVNYQGGLVCQALMTYHGRARKLILDDLFALELEELNTVFDSAPGSFLLEKMAKTIPEKKFIELLKKLPIDKIAFGRSGSRAVEGVAKEANMKVKGVLCELLSEVHAELGASQFGRHVNHKLRVTDYVKNKQRWEMNQKGVSGQQQRGGQQQQQRKRKQTGNNNGKRVKTE